MDLAIKSTVNRHFQIASSHPAFATEESQRVLNELRNVLVQDLLRCHIELSPRSRIPDASPGFSRVSSALKPKEVRTALAHPESENLIRNTSEEKDAEPVVHALKSNSKGDARILSFRQSDRNTGVAITDSRRKSLTRSTSRIDPKAVKHLLKLGDTEALKSDSFGEAPTVSADRFGRNTGVAITNKRPKSISRFTSRIDPKAVKHVLRLGDAEALKSNSFGEVPTVSSRQFGRKTGVAITNKRPKSKILRFTSRTDPKRVKHVLRLGSDVSPRADAQAEALDGDAEAFKISFRQSDRDMGVAITHKRPKSLTRCTSRVDAKAVSQVLKHGDDVSPSADIEDIISGESETELEPATPRSTEIIKSAIAVVHELCSYELTMEQNATLLAAFNYFLKTYVGMPVVMLIASMRTKVEPKGLSKLANFCLREIPVFRVRELARVAAYADFRVAVLGMSQLLRVEVRLEGRYAYCLLPPEDTVLVHVDGIIAKSLLWVHDKAWIQARFKDGGKDLGLIGGERVGDSKFVSACAAIPRSKGEALDALGLRGYAAFDKPGVLYCIRASMTPVLLRRAQPRVPLLYNVASAEDSDVTSSETWGPSPHFQEGVMPGFTSARRSELVIITYKLDVDTAEELARHGVTCVELAD